MKKLLFVLLFALGSGIHFEAKAQVDVNINLGSQPSWGPAGYDYVDYYYLPDIESYYYVPKKQFIYMGNNGWQFTNALPPKYKGYNLYNGYKVVINSPSPYLSFKTHKIKYAKYKGNHGQSVIAKSKKYTVAKGNSQLRKSVSHQKPRLMKAQNFKGNGKGNHQGNGKGKH